MNNEFKKISSTETVKEAWTILQTTHEGTMAVKDSKFQMLTTSFKEIKMEEDESFDELYAKFKNIVNSAFNLGKTIPEPKIVERCLDLFQRDSMPRSPPLKNQMTLIKFLW